MPLMNFTEMTRMQNVSLKEQDERNKEIILCPKCKCPWFEEITIHKYALNHTLILGQAIPPGSNSIGYKVLKCIKCSNYVEPTISYYNRDYGAQDYNQLLDLLDTLKTQEEPIQDLVDGKIPSEKL